MSVPDKDNYRLLLELEKMRRDVNRDVINAALPVISLEDLRPILVMTANARAAYIARTVEVSRAETQISAQHVAELQSLRHTYDELVAAANALETAINRGYLDIVARPHHHSG